MAYSKGAGKSKSEDRSPRGTSSYKCKVCPEGGARGEVVEERERAQ